MEFLARVLGTAFLIGVAALLFDAIQMPTAPSVGTAPEQQVVSATTADAPAKEPETAIQRDAAYFSPVLERPLFSVTRRPQEPEPIKTVKADPVPEEEVEPEPTLEQVVVAPQLDLPKVSLLGVMSEGSRRQALISVEGNPPIWLKRGEKIGDWTIAETGADWLELDAENNKVRLELFE